MSGNNPLADALGVRIGLIACGALLAVIAGFNHELVTQPLAAGLRPAAIGAVAWWILFGED